MTPVELLAAVTSLFLAVAVGLVVHELAHAAALRASGIPYDVAWFPGSDASESLGAGLAGRWASVTPRKVPDGTAPWRIRAAAMAPLVLALPFVPVAVGAAPDPLATGLLPFQLAVVGWLACALPSPQDFSVLWYADRALDAEAESGHGD